MNGIYQSHIEVNDATGTIYCKTIIIDLLKDDTTSKVISFIMELT